MLNAVEVRVLGSLIEKDMTTPEYYPLTLNALAAACNQKNNRHPVVSYNDDTVSAALESLRAKGLVLMVLPSAGSRVAKYAHRISENWNLGRRELAVMCVLLLRGPQTPGEINARTERMCQFSDLTEVESCLERLMHFEPDPLAVRLPRQPGAKESRYAHLLSGPPEIPATPVPAAAGTMDDDRIGKIEARVEEIAGELRQLRSEFDELMRQLK